MRQGPFLLGLGLLTSATLALEVLDTRLLSVLTWYSFAFFVIAMGLCGLTAGAVRVYFLGARLTPERLPAELSRAALLFALAVPVSYVGLLILPLRSEPIATTVVLFLVFSAVLAMPFYPAGVAIAAAVTRTRFPVGRVYAVDLLGAALGAPLVPLLLRILDGGSAIILTGVLAAAASLAFARAGRDAQASRRAAWAFALLATLTLWNRSTDRGLRPLWVKERPELYAQIEKELWNSHARVEVFRAAPAPALFWGLGSRCPDPVVTQRVLVIDGHAATPLYHATESLESLRFIECDVTDVANLLRPGGASAVIGVGGSRDVQAALLAGHSPVVGIELNDRLLEVLESPMGDPTLITHRPDVRLVHDDARSYLSRSTEQFRVVQASLIDTWAASGAGAHALGENGLYTIEAWRTFLDRLEPGGVFTVSRWATVETARMVALAVATLLDRGAVRPRDHLALVSAGLVTTLIVGRDPLTRTDTETLRRIAGEKGFAVTVAPGEHVEADRLENVLSATSRAELDRYTLLDDLDFRPSTDDRPFFFNVVRLTSLWRPLPPQTEGTIIGNLLATRTLGLTVFASLVLAAASIIGPLAYRARPSRRVSPGLVAAFFYFGLIGVGFMLVEIAVLQRLSIVLGHPIYSLIVVLSSLVGAAGLGSLLSDALPLTRAPYCFVFPAFIGAVLALFALIWPAIAPTLIAAPTPLRIAWSVGVTTVIGLPLGIAFPTGMRLAREAHAEETPWLWGLNGVGSVLSSSLAILIALTCGLSVLLIVGAACYLALVPAIVVMRRGSAATP